MKITSTLPNSICLSDGKQMAWAHAGLIKGWSDLPPDIQKIVEWAGMRFVEETHNSEMIIEIKLSILVSSGSSITYLKPSRQFSVRVSTLTEKDVEEKMRSEVLAIVENLKEDINRQAKTIENLLK